MEKTKRIFKKYEVFNQDLTLKLRYEGRPPRWNQKIGYPLREYNERIILSQGNTGTIDFTVPTLVGMGQNRFSKG